MAAQGARVSLLHDDSEEDLVGADWHQTAIRTLSDCLTTLAAERGWPWHVGDQLTLVGWKPDGTPWRPSPDVLVHPTAGPTPRQELVAREEGVPALIVEVLSATTWTYDVNLDPNEEGKGFGYLYVLGVPEYLVFDPQGSYVPGRCRGWQRVGGIVREWQPSATGHYQSQALGIALRPEGDLLRVFGPQGQPVLYSYEKSVAITALRQTVAAREQEIARRDQEVAAREQEIARRDQEIAELRAQLEKLRGEQPS